MDTRKNWEGSGVFLPPWWKKMMKEKYGIEYDKPWTGVSEVYSPPMLRLIDKQKKQPEN
jgi:hypothetical protein